MNMDDEQGHPFDLGHHQTNHHKVMAQLLRAIATQGYGQLGKARCIVGIQL